MIPINSEELLQVSQSLSPPALSIVWRSERRLRFRYSLDLSVRFRSRPGMSLFSGTGRVVNVSSGGALVASELIGSRDEISMGERVEMSIEWPPLLDGRIPLQLFAVGRVLRRGASDFAVAFERYQFRTRISSGRLYNQVP
jgi:hypothetical protein